MTAGRKLLNSLFLRQASAATTRLTPRADTQSRAAVVVVHDRITAEIRLEAGRDETVHRDSGLTVFGGSGGTLPLWQAWLRDPSVSEGAAIDLSGGPEELAFLLSGAWLTRDLIARERLGGSIEAVSMLNRIIEFGVRRWSVESPRLSCWAWGEHVLEQRSHL